MTVRSDNYYLLVHFADGSYLSWTECSPELAEEITRKIEEQGPPFREKEELGWVVINPEHVRYVQAKRQNLNCPYCGYVFVAQKTCTHPEYH